MSSQDDRRESARRREEENYGKLAGFCGNARRINSLREKFFA
jgi:hypothetical protein